MSEVKDNIRSVIQNLIKDNNAGAEMDLRPVFTAKMKEAAGIATSNVEDLQNEIDENE